jgi:hypothetical protein
MKDRYNRESDDSYMMNRYAMMGKKVVKAKDGYKFTGKPHRSVSYFLDRGRGMYRLGYEPVHVLASVLWGLGNVFAYFSYLGCCVSRPEKFDVVDYVRKKQLARLTRWL